MNDYETTIYEDFSKATLKAIYNGHILLAV